MFLPECFLQTTAFTGETGMNFRNLMLLFALSSFIGVVHGDDDEVSLAAAPPVVVKTTPEAGMDKVDPTMTEIKVTFSKDMSDGSWS